jgi:hypothetical protein
MKKSVTRRDVLKMSILTASAIVPGASHSSGAIVSNHESHAALGVPRGMPGKEGRVVWEHDPSAVIWKGQGFWWEDNNIIQGRVDNMVLGGLKHLTDTSTAAAAWDVLFRHFNRGGSGYRPGERVAIKVNLNNAGNPNDDDADATQHAVLALLKTLIFDGGVPGGDITVYDATHNPKFQRGKMPSRIIAYCRKQGGELLKVRWVDSYGENGAIMKELTGDILTYSVAENNVCGKRIPTCLKEAKYLINMALLKGHVTGGVTLTAKNHYGTINPGKDHVYLDPLNTTVGPLPRYSPLVDIMASPEIGQKTLLYVIDALLGALQQQTVNTPWFTPPFNGHHTSSLLFSLDPVAIDTVAYDLLLHAYQDPRQPNKNSGVAERLPGADNYLHEAALAQAAPSGVKYVQNGKPVESLGIHEHANLSVPIIGQRYQAIQLVYTLASAAERTSG